MNTFFLFIALVLVASLWAVSRYCLLPDKLDKGPYEFLGVITALSALACTIGLVICCVRAVHP